MSSEHIISDERCRVEHLCYNGSPRTVTKHLSASRLWSLAITRELSFIAQVDIDLNSTGQDVLVSKDLESSNSGALTCRECHILMFK